MAGKSVALRKRTPPLMDDALCRTGGNLLDGATDRCGLGCVTVFDTAYIAKVAAFLGLLLSLRRLTVLIQFFLDITGCLLGFAFREREDLQLRFRQPLKGR